MSLRFAPLKGHLNTRQLQYDPLPPPMHSLRSADRDLVTFSMSNYEELPSCAFPLDALYHFLGARCCYLSVPVSVFCVLWAFSAFYVTNTY